MEITPDMLDGLQQQINTTEIIKNEAYCKGKNPGILAEPDKRDPDNKVPVATGYRLKANLTGFAARTGDIYIDQKPKDGEDTNDTPFEVQRREIDEDNNALLLNSALYNTAVEQGIAYDVVWTVEEAGALKIKFAQIPNYQAVPIWSNELTTVKQLEGFVRFWSDDVVVGTDAEAQEFAVQKGMKATKEFAQVFDNDGYTLYSKVGNGKWIFQEEVSQPFGQIQVSPYRANQTATPYIDPVMTLLDQQDKLISRNMNEVERFNNTILGLLKKVSPEVKSAIDEMGVIDNLMEGLEDTPGTSVFPKFISRDIPTDHAKMMLEQLDTKIYSIMGSPNFTDESFGTASGIALIYRLIGLEYTAAEIDVWYDQGLQNRNTLINKALELSDSESEAFVPVVIHKRNLPVDLAFLAKVAIDMKTSGLSMETILRIFPKTIIPDVKAEMDRIASSTPIEVVELDT
jgi:SPP1 family phage portal protein